MQEPRPVRVPPAQARLLSLDLFRGLVVAAMIFVNNGGVGATPFLGHSTWDGLGFADLVFPSFVFIVGVSMALWFCRHPQMTGKMWRRFLIRCATLFGLGLLINALYATAEGIRAIGYNGVLQRIALGSLIAAPFARRKPSTVVWVAIALLAAHTALLIWMPVPGATAGDLARPGATFPAYVDGLLRGVTSVRLAVGDPGHLDPENLVGVISTAAGMLLGVAAGAVLFVRRKDASVILVAAGAVALVAGMVLSPWLAVNKHLWTATFVLVTAGIDAIVLAGLHEIVDVRRHERFACWVEPLGRNALVVYAGSTILDGLLLLVPVSGGSLYAVLEGSFRMALGGRLGSVVFAVANVAAWYAIAVWMGRRRIYIRL